MISWRLWNALRRRRLLYARYERVFLPRNVSDTELGIFRRVRRSTAVLWVVGLVGLILLCTTSWILIIPILCLIPFVVLGLGIISGVLMTNQVAGLISRTQTQALYDTLSVLPRGTFALDWAVTAYVFQRSRTLIVIRDFLSKAAIVLLFGTFAILAVGIVFAATAYGFSLNLLEETVTIFSGTIPFFIILGVVFVDLIHCTLVGGIVGMLVPTYVNDRVVASLLAIGITLLVVIGYYVVIAVILTSILPPLFRMNGLRVGADGYVSQFLVFYGGRELLIYWLWYLLMQRINASPAVIEELFGN